MTDNGVHKIKLSELIERERTKGSLDVELSDGTVFRIDPPDLWSDEIQEINADPTKDAGDLGRALLGEKKWKRFLDDGGSGNLFGLLIVERWQLSQGESAASSSS